MNQDEALQATAKHRARAVGLLMRKMIIFGGRDYFDDRLFVLDVAPVTTRSLTTSQAPNEKWAVITRRNVPGYLPGESITSPRGRRLWHI